MKIISGDADAVGEVIDRARQIHRLVVNGGLALGVADVEGKAEAILTVLGEDGGLGVGVTIGPTPRLVDMTDAQPPAPARAGVTCVSEEHYYEGYEGDCVCTARCCNDATGACICLTCTNERHDHG